MKRKYTGMTLIEILMVVGIIVVLGGLLIPAMTMVKRTANQAKQRAELNTIELAITTFKHDYGDYPPSGRQNCEDDNGYSGAQKLAEALCGWDLLGFDPCSVWRSDGRNCNDTADVYPSPLDLTNPAHMANLRTRRGPYLDTANISVFKLGSLFNNLTGEGVTMADTYVLTDVFGVRNTRQSSGKIVTAGTPILYYKANPASRDPNISTTYSDRIYNVTDNRYLVALRPLTTSGAVSTETHPISDNASNYKAFYDFISDRRGAIPWSYHPESYILISAGPDGRYGTRDDICNFPTPP